MDMGVGSVSSPLRLWYQPVSPEELPPWPPGFRATGKAFNLSLAPKQGSVPGSGSLIKPVTIRVRLSAQDALLANGVENSVTIQRFLEEDQRWAVLPTAVDFRASVARAQTDQLSIFALTIKEPDPTPIPSPVSEAQPTPDPMDTPVPSRTTPVEPTQTPSPTASPVSVPTPTPTPSLSVTPSRVPTPTRSPAPDPTPTPLPTPAPRPTSTAIPTPIPTPTPEPSPTPTPTRTPIPAPTPVPRFVLSIGGLPVGAE